MDVNFKTPIHVWHHEQAFYYSVLPLMLLFAIPSTCPSQRILWFLGILFPYYSPIKPFFYFLFVLSFDSEIILLPLYSDFHLPSTVFWVEFSFVTYEIPVCLFLFFSFTWPSSDKYWIFLHSPIWLRLFLPLLLSNLSALCFGIFILIYICACFFFLSTFNLPVLLV